MFWTDYYFPPIYTRELNHKEASEIRKALRRLMFLCPKIDASIPIGYLTQLLETLEADEEYKTAEEHAKDLIRRRIEAPASELARLARLEEEQAQMKIQHDKDMQNIFGLKTQHTPTSRTEKKETRLQHKAEIAAITAKIAAERAAPSASSESPETPESSEPLQTPPKRPKTQKKRDTTETAEIPETPDP